MELINAGRGSGKSYNLVKWQKEEPEIRWIVALSSARKQALIDEGADPRRVITWTQLRAVGFSAFRRHEVQIAFDDFHEAIEDWLHQLGVANTNSVILVTNMAESEVGPKVTTTPVSETYANAIREKYGAGLAFLTEVIEKGAEAVEPLLQAVDPEAKWTEGLWKDKAETKQKPVPEEAEPDTKKVRADQLRLNDVIVGKGRIVSMKLDYQTRDYYKVEIELKAAGFAGKLSVGSEAFVEIENK